jgi:hypothetical protein
MRGGVQIVCYTLRLCRIRVDRTDDLEQRRGRMIHAPDTVMRPDGA